MAEINLRHYVQEIDDLIEDSDRLDEAIAHCRYILQTFPKHIDTYRLLGKAYLESKRFGDSADIFQRVLSALPDDYVSHVGMAIIREDEGNLDASIWHMERASESKPGNAAIEQELKRLIGKRDGLEPQRVRPSRGALARMYSHGELFSYAITELKRALEEDSDRPDLQVLLANTYWRTDQRLEAVRLCSDILEKLPFCRDANRITAALLLESGKSAEAGRNIHRLVSLDPYFAHLKDPMADPLSVEASAIVLDKLVWMHGEPLAGEGESRPDWAASLGVDFRSESSEDEEGEEEVPDWLKAKEEEEETTPEIPKTGPIPIHPFAGAEPPIGADIPQWMQEAGWVESDGTAVETSPDVLMDAVGGGDEPQELAAAEMPDWLSQISPSEQLDDVAPIEETGLESDDGSVDEDFLDSLGIQPGSESEMGIESAAPDMQAEVGIGAEMGTAGEPPDWLEGIASEESETESAESEPSESVPDEGSEEPIDLFSAMRFDEDSDRAEEEMPGDIFDEVSSGEVPSELEPAISETPPTEEPATGSDSSVEDFEEFEVEGGTRDLPSWLGPATPGATDTIVSWLGDKSADEFSTPSEDIPTWMKGTGPLIERPANRPPEGEVAVPEPDELADDPFPFTQEPQSVLSDKAEPESDQAGPDWLEDASPLDSEAEETLLQDEDQEPGWIDEASVDEEQVPEITSEETPGWLQEFSDVDEELEQPIEEDQPEWLTSVSMPADDTAEPEDQEQPEWLRTLAAETPVEEVEETETEEPPEWVSEMAPAETEAEAPEEEAPPDWMLELEEETAEPKVAFETQMEEPTSEEDTEAEAIPEWMLELDQEPSEPLSSEPSLMQEVIDEREAIPPATEGPEAEPESAPESTAERVAESTPSMETDFTEEPPPGIGDEMETISAEAEMQAIPADDIPWMDADQKAAAESGSAEIAEEAQPEAISEEADAEETSSIMDTAIEDEEAPEWLRDLAVDELPSEPVDFVAAEDAQLDAEPAMDAEREAAEWLQRIETESTTDISITPLDETAGADIEPEMVGEVDGDAWQPEFEETESDDGELDTGELMTAEKEIEHRLDWLQDSARAVAPEPEVEVPETSPEPISAEVDSPEIADRAEDELEEGEVFEYLESLAEKGDAAGPESIAETTAREGQGIEFEADEALAEEELPEELDAGLEWLEELASDEEYEEVIAPDFQADEAGMEDTDIPDWLEEVAEPAGEDQPHAEEPRTDMEDIEQPDIEPIDAILENIEPDVEDIEPDVEDIEPDVENIEHGVENIGLEFVEVEGKAKSPPEEKDSSILDTIVTKRPVFDTIEFDRRELMTDEPEAPLEEIKPEGEDPSEPTPALMPETSGPPVRFEAEVETSEPIPPEVEEPQGEVEGALDNLTQARKALESGDIESALDLYAEMIEEKQDLDSVTHDLESAVEKTPMSPILWQTLGDAYMQMGQVTDAIDAYRKGMEAV